MWKKRKGSTIVVSQATVQCCFDIFICHESEWIAAHWRWSNSPTCDINWFHGNFTDSFPESVITTDKVASVDLVVYESTYFNCIRRLIVTYLSTWKKCYVQNTAGRQSVSHITSTTKPFVGLMFKRQDNESPCSKGVIVTETVLLVWCLKDNRMNCLTVKVWQLLRGFCWFDVSKTTEWIVLG
jgi:hypothetical protein